MSIRRMLIGVMLAAMAVIPAAQVQAAGLDDIISRGNVRVGIDLSLAPFASQDATLQPAGYDVEVAKFLAKDLGVKLEIVPLSGPNRIPFLMTNRVDFVIAAFTITPERAKSVAFSDPYCALSTALVARSDSNIKTVANLSGKRVAVARGTTNESDVMRLAPADTEIVRFDDDASAQAALLAGQVDAYVVGDTIIKQLIARNPSAGLEIKLNLAWVYSGIATQRKDPDLVRWVNTSLAAHKNNGDLAALYTKFFGGDLPNLPVF